MKKPSLNLKNPNLIFAAGLAGILLIAFASFTRQPAATQAMAASSAPAAAPLESYEQKLEQRLEEILGSVAGVGRVQVMVTLESGYGYEYAKENKQGSDLLSDVKAQEAQKTQEKTTREESYVMVDAGSGNKKPLVTKELEPTVKGVVIVCEGGNSPVTVAKIIETVGVAAGVSSNKISVCPMEKATP